MSFLKFTNTVTLSSMTSISAISDLLLGQPQAKILVGDPHQQIYSFRGAVNALQQIRASFIFYLTQVRQPGNTEDSISQAASEAL